MGRREVQTHTYFEIQLGCRKSSTRDPLVRVTPNTWCLVGRAVLMRVLDKADVEQARIQAFDKRGFQSVMLGDPTMGKKLTLAATWEEEQSVVIESTDGITTLRVSYQLVQNSSHGEFADAWAEGRPFMLSPRLSSRSIG